MKTEILNTKWYWWIPIIGLYFIEEMSGWVFDSIETSVYVKRMLIAYFNMAYHVLGLVLIILLVSK
jgi:hypothetical protein